MAWILTKYILTTTIIVVASELAKRSDRLGSFIASLPFVTILVLIWLHIENQPQQKIANHAWFTFWYVIPTLPMFLIFPIFLSRLGFWLALGACIVVTLICFGFLVFFVRYFGIKLL